MPLTQDQSLDLLVSSPARYHCTTDASFLMGTRWNENWYCVNGEWLQLQKIALHSTQGEKSESQYLGEMNVKSAVPTGISGL